MGPVAATDLVVRRNEPDLPRPYRAPRGTITLGLIAAAGWGGSTIFGFEQFGLPTVLAGLVLAYSGAAAYAFRQWRDRAGAPKRVKRSLHLKLTGAMLAVMVLDGAGLPAGRQPRAHHRPDADHRPPGHLRGGGHPHRHRRPGPAGA